MPARVPRLEDPERQQTGEAMDVTCQNTGVRGLQSITEWSKWKRWVERLGNQKVAGGHSLRGVYHLSHSSDWKLQKAKLSYSLLYL